MNSIAYMCSPDGDLSCAGADRGGEVGGGEVQIPTEGMALDADLCIPAKARGLVLFAHGSGSGRHSPRNRFVAWTLQCAGFGTLLFDLLTRQEEIEDTADGHLRFDVELLARRLTAAAVWSAAQPRTAGLKIGIFGSSTGAAAALLAAAKLGHGVSAIVCRGGRLDLASEALPEVVAPTLLIVGERDDSVLDLNRAALARLACEKQLEIVPNATHLFEEPNALNVVAARASNWFQAHLATAGSASRADDKSDAPVHGGKYCAPGRCTKR